MINSLYSGKQTVNSWVEMCFVLFSPLWIILHQHVSLSNPFVPTNLWKHKHPTDRLYIIFFKNAAGYHFPPEARRGSPLSSDPSPPVWASLYLSSCPSLFNDRRKVISVVIISGRGPDSSSQSEDSTEWIWPMRGWAESVLFTQHSHHYTKYIFRSYPHEHPLHLSGHLSHIFRRLT